MLQTIYPGINDTLYDRYLIQDEIGRGGYSIVYRAADKNVGGTVALKVLVPPPAQSGSMFARLKREALALRDLNHPNIIRGLDLHIEMHRAVLVMQLIDGMDLSKFVEKNGTRPVDEVRNLGTKMADALHTAHSAGLIHRDVKPQNILLDQSGQCFLSDFGSAQLIGQSSLTVTGAIVGTLGFIAPEAFTQSKVDSRADIFSLGATLYYALTGMIPNMGQAGALPISRDGFDPRAVRPELDPWISGVIARSTCADPADRFQTAESFSHALKVKSGEQPPAIPTALRPIFCLACGEEGQSHIGVCSRCLALQGGQEMISVYLSPIAGKRAQKQAKQQLLDIFPTQAKERLIYETLTGVRPLLKAPEQLIKPILKQLSTAGFPAHAADKNILKNIPREMMTLAFIVLTLGMLSGAGAILPSLAVFSALICIPWSMAGTPLAEATENKETLSAPTHSRLLQSFSKLKQSPARKVLARIAAAAAQLAGTEDGVFTRTEIEEVVRHSADAADRVDSMDTVLSNLKTDSNHLDLLLRAERLREQAMQTLLQALALFSEIQLYQSESEPQSASNRLSDLCQEMRDSARLYTEAYRELGPA